MSKIKQYGMVILAIAIICMLPACSQKKPQEDSVKIVFSEKALGIAKMTPEEWVADLIATSEENYVDVYVNEDGESVTLEITEEQRDYWIASREGLLDTLRAKFGQEGAEYRIECSEDYSHVDMYYNLELDGFDAIYYVIYTEVICISQQLFMGVGQDEWYVSFDIYNSDTGKLVSSGDSNTGLSYREADWEASM